MLDRIGKQRAILKFLKRTSLLERFGTKASLHAYAGLYSASLQEAIHKFFFVLNESRALKILVKSTVIKY